AQVQQHHPRLLVAIARPKDQPQVRRIGHPRRRRQRQPVANPRRRKGRVALGQVAGVGARGSGGSGTRRERT
ncbi:MAG: hypothetical protein WCF05_08860, partial [Chromatiaceae bacterium]